MSEIPALLFDLDGCVVDSLASIVRLWRETLPDYGLPVPPEAAIRANVGPPVDTSARQYAPDADDAMIETIVRDYRARSAAATDVMPFPGMLELIGALDDRGVALAVATSKSIEVAEPLLARLDLTRRFRVVEGTRREELGTDKATIVARAVAGLAPLQPVAHIGDRHHDVEGAHANGLSAIGVLWGYGSREELTAAGADVIVETPAALAEHLMR